jgi:hypothetical protein
MAFGSVAIVGQTLSQIVRQVKDDGLVPFGFHRLGDFAIGVDVVDVDPQM